MTNFVGRKTTSQISTSSCSLPPVMGPSRQTTPIHWLSDPVVLDPNSTTKTYGKPKMDKKVVNIYHVQRGTDCEIKRSEVT